MIVKYKLLSIAILLLSIIILFATKTYTKVNATSTALLINLIILPSIVIEGILCIVVFFSRNQRRVIIIQAILLVILLYWFTDYAFIKK